MKYWLHVHMLKHFLPAEGILVMLFHCFALRMFDKRLGTHPQLPNYPRGTASIIKQIGCLASAQLLIPI